MPEGLISAAAQSLLPIAINEVYLADMSQGRNMAISGEVDERQIDHSEGNYIAAQ